MSRDFTARFGALGEERLTEFFQRVGQLVVFALFLRPGADLIDPLTLIAAVELAPVDAGIFQQRIQLAHARQPVTFDLSNLREDLLVT